MDRQCWILSVLPAQDELHQLPSGLRWGTDGGGETSLPLCQNMLGYAKMPAAFMNELKAPAPYFFIFLFLDSQFRINLVCITPGFGSPRVHAPSKTSHFSSLSCFNCLLSDRAGVCLRELYKGHPLSLISYHII